jgi:hypothetical protein
LLSTHYAVVVYADGLVHAIFSETLVGNGYYQASTLHIFVALEIFFLKQNPVRYDSRVIRK